MRIKRFLSAHLFWYIFASVPLIQTGRALAKLSLDIISSKVSFVLGSFRQYD